MEERVQDIVRGMWSYQQQHGIRGRCMDNALFLKDSINAVGGAARVKAVFAEWTIDGQQCCGIHMVVQVLTKVIDPSYEVGQDPHAEYFPTIHGSRLASVDGVPSEMSRRELVAAFLEFVEIAQRINNGEVLVTDRQYYNAQADALGAIEVSF